MRCKSCGGFLRVQVSMSDDMKVVRRRRCRSCGTVVYTQERVTEDARGIYNKEIYSRRKVK